MSQPNLLTPRTKRLYSLPSRPVIPPHITIQGCHDNKDSHSEEEEPSCECSNDSMGKRTEKGFFEIFFSLIFYQLHEESGSSTVGQMIR